MINKLYNYFNPEELHEAEILVGFLTDRIAEIKGKIKLTDTEKKIKIKRITLSINCIKYTYGID
jgi:hydroxylamine reductase (hybrid-cluster protein)